MRRLLKIFLIVFLIYVFSVENLFCISGNPLLKNESGFITIKPVTFYFHQGSYTNRLQLTSSEACMWYSFFPADHNGKYKPLFLFFNGGHAGATSSGLMCSNTSPWTFNNETKDVEASFIKNPHSWTRMGNLLYIDSRLAGFSYGLMSNPGDGNARYREFNSQNFNMYIDAADYIRVLLKFLSIHSDLQKNPVILVGESKGGTRSTIMLHILLNYMDYGNGKEIYQDQELVENIKTHFNRVFPEYNNQTVPTEIIAGQFSHQILIQPAIARGYELQVTGEMFEMEGSVIYQIAAETGVEYIPCWKKNPADVECDPYTNALDFVELVAKRDIYMYSKPAGWIFGVFQNAALALQYTGNLMKVTGVVVTDIRELYASSRANAYKINQINSSQTRQLNRYMWYELMHTAEPPSGKIPEIGDFSGDLNLVFGELRPWDRYFLWLNYDAAEVYAWNIARFKGYDITYFSPKCGRMFLKNVVYVNTFITNAPHDLVVYTKALPRTLRLYTDILERSVHYHEGETVDNRSGQIILTYHPDAYPDIANIGTRTIRFPLYAFSSHAVSLDQPADLYDDVAAWLSNTSLTISR